MVDFFASIYEWFGLIPFYSKDLGDHMRGYDITCSGYIGTPWYVYIGWIMIILTIFIFCLQYFILDGFNYSRRYHWWIFAVIVVALNFLIAFAIPFNSIHAFAYCKELNLSVSDCIGFGLSNSIWSLILFLFLTSFKYPRDWANNCRHTTFWKP